VKEAEKALARLEQAAAAERSELLQQMARLTDEIAQLRQVLQEALPRLALPAPDYTRQVMEEFERDHRAYEQKEAQLLAEHRGEFAAICDGELVAVGPDETRVMQEALRLKPGSRVY
jgi:cell division septum initiation protein DivIVA